MIQSPVCAVLSVWQFRACGCFKSPTFRSPFCSKHLSTLLSTSFRYPAIFCAIPPLLSCFLPPMFLFTALFLSSLSSSSPHLFPSFRIHFSSHLHFCHGSRLFTASLLFTFKVSWFCFPEVTFQTGRIWPLLLSKKWSCWVLTWIFAAVLWSALRFWIPFTWWFFCRQ